MVVYTHTCHPHPLEWSQDDQELKVSLSYIADFKTNLGYNFSCSPRQAKCGALCWEKSLNRRRHHEARDLGSNSALIKLLNNLLCLPFNKGRPRHILSLLFKCPLSSIFLTVIVP